MELNRTSNAKRNMVFGLLNRFISLAMPFINRTVFIYILGAEYLGLNSLFASILQMLSLAELGVGGVIVYHMYEPIARNDRAAICALLNLYRRIYRIIGTAILIVGLCLIPFLPQLIHGDVPADVNLYIVYGLYLINTVISYWFFIYKASIPNAFQRADLVSNIATLVQIVQAVVQIAVVYFMQSYYAYLVVMPLSTLLNNFLIAYVVGRYYPQFHCAGKVAPEIVRDIKIKVAGMMIHRVCGTTRNSLDSICLASFVGLAITGIYNNYYYVIASVTSFFAIFSTAVVAGVGNSIVLYDTEKNYQDMRRINFLYMLLAGWSSVFLLLLYQPFMQIWVGEEMMLPLGMAVLFMLYFYVLKMGDIRALFVDAAGLWWEQRWRAIAETLANLVLNIALGLYFGVWGIVIATLISLFCINFCWGSRIVFDCYFKNGKAGEYYRDHAIYFVVMSVVVSICYAIGSAFDLNIYFAFVYRFVVALIVPPVLFYLCYRHWSVAKVAAGWFAQRFHLEKWMKGMI